MFLGSTTLVRVHGLEHLMIEVVEQFAWLGAACRASPHQRRIAVTSARLVAETDYNFHFKLEYSVRELSPQEQRRIQYENCWRSLFKNPVIAEGFPILARSGSVRGLEITLDLMAGLGLTESLMVFDDCLIIKGFSTMFVPTKKTGNLVQWHFLCNEDGSRMSFLEAAKQCPRRVSTETLDIGSSDCTRHFVGWASSVVMQTGEYTVEVFSIIYPGSL